MADPPVDNSLGGDTIRCPQCSEPWHVCQCATRKVSLSTGSLADESGQPGPESAPDTPLAKVDKYEIVGMLGEGAVGTVYLAYHEVLRKKVAVKILRKELLGNLSVVERLRREAQACAMLSHPNIVSVLDFGLTESSFPFLVMDYLEGADLKQAIREAGKLETREVVKIAVQICSALETAHHHGVIHRDLKPTNILLIKQQSGEPMVKIVDFGVASAGFEGGEQQRLTQTGELIGSPGYMSPEQISGRPVDGRSDIYSLGCILYEMLKGRPPFRGESMMSVLQANLEEQPELDVAPDDPPALSRLNRIVLRCLEKDAAERYQSAAEVRVELERVIPDESRNSHRGWAVAAAVSGVVLIVVLVLSMARGNPSASDTASAPGTRRRPQQGAGHHRIDYLTLGRLLDYTEYSDDTAIGCFHRAYRHSRNINRKILAAFHLIDWLRPRITKSMKPDGRFDPQLSAEMRSIKDQVDRFARRSKTDASINTAYVAHCYYCYAWFLKQQADCFQNALKIPDLPESTVKRFKQSRSRLRDEAVFVLREAVRLMQSRRKPADMSQAELTLLSAYYDYLAQSLHGHKHYKVVAATRQKMIQLGRLMSGGADSSYTMELQVKLASAYKRAHEYEKARQAYEVAYEYFSKHDTGRARKVKASLDKIRSK